VSRQELFLNHDLMLNDVRIAFYRALAVQSGLKLDRWVGSNDCLQEWTMSILGVDRRQRMIFRPDGYVRYYQDFRLFGCFLEVDRSTMSNGRFQSAEDLTAGRVFEPVWERPGKEGVFSLLGP
jgi:hypothetical protein